MSKAVSRGARLAAVCAVGLACVAFGFRRSDHRWCSVCWASMETLEFGVAITDDLRLPLWRSTRATAEPPECVARFIPTGHVHDADRRGLGAAMDGPYLMHALWCGRSLPGGFARELGADADFAEFVAARVADKSVPIATVRALIAVPDLRRDEDFAEDPVHRALMRQGDELLASFRRVDPATIDVWGIAPR